MIYDNAEKRLLRINQRCLLKWGFQAQRVSWRKVEVAQQLWRSSQPLVVDDDLVIQRIHKMYLNRFGFETQVVGNGKEAVDLYRSGAFFHLVLMDMEMPVMDGPKVCFLSFILFPSFILKWYLISYFPFWRVLQYAPLKRSVGTYYFGIY